MSKRILDQKGVPYEVINVDEDPEALDHIKSLGYQSLPVILTDSGDHFSGFQPDRLAALAI